MKISSRHVYMFIAIDLSDYILIRSLKLCGLLVIKERKRYVQIN